MTATHILTQFQDTGRVWLRDAFDPDAVTGHDDTARPGARIAASDPQFAQVAQLPALGQIAKLWPGMRPVRMVSFAKQEGRNWAVPWHQDRIIAVKERADVAGFGNWSCKGGDWHCEAPLDVLKRMLFVRLHLDASTAQNGAMEIALGSHRLGLVPAPDAEARAGACETEITQAAPGDILVLSMLTLHRSRPSQVSAPRRVLRVDMSAHSLTAPLEWAV
ncbi:MAG: phytanoyl-CoA dioxygenase family protein [Roseovarius sp.]